MLWLINQMIVLGFSGDWLGSYDAFCWIKVHWKYQSKKIK